MISNTSDKSKCAACETPKPGKSDCETVASETCQPTFNFGGSGGFKFVDNNTDTPKSDSPFANFKFGISQPAAPTSESGGFKFGLSSSESKQETNEGFKFGSSG